jgi:hypothetical protein
MALPNVVGACPEPQKGPGPPLQRYDLLFVIRDLTRERPFACAMATAEESSNSRGRRRSGETSLGGGSLHAAMTSGLDVEANRQFVLPRCPYQVFRAVLGEGPAA